MRYGNGGVRALWCVRWLFAPACYLPAVLMNSGSRDAHAVYVCCVAAAV